MTDGNAIRSAQVRNLMHHPIANVTCFGLDGGGTTMSAKSYRADMEGNRQTVAQRFDAPLVFL
jgi:hypothetical protein